MTIKTLLFCLFLYICLVWVGSAYVNGAGTPEFIHYGLLFTAIGLIAVLAFIIGARLLGWWRLWRATAAARPAAALQPLPAAHPDDEAMSALLAEANAALAKAPSFAGRQGGASIPAMPLYLLVGPEGSGKTSTFLNSATEPQLLAGQGTAPVASTRLCNFWLAKDAIFAEMGGRTFAADLSRWSKSLEALRGQAKLPFWRRIWGDTEPQMNLRGVIAFCDCKEFIAASSDPQRLERYSRTWQERLRAIAGCFGTEFPVYVVLTKCDAIPFFVDFFRRLPETQVNQVLGCTLAARGSQPAARDEVFAEAEAKRLTSSFRPLYHALARRRLSQLAHEPNPAQRLGVYEFPREFKRIRSPLVQFLTDVFRPNSLGPNLVLRGYYLTGVRETVQEYAAAGRGTGPETQAPMETTRMFRGDVTQLFQGDDATKVPGPPGRKTLGWMFVADLFHRVILPDQPPRKQRPVESRIERYRKLVFGAVCGLCISWCLAFLVSYWNNRQLLLEIGAAAQRQTTREGRPTTAQDLRALEALRVQLVRLEGRMPWRFHWFLYSGDRVLDKVRYAYFRQFHRLLLSDLNGQMVADLRGLPASPDAASPFEQPYDALRAHLMITSGSCAVDSAFLSRELKEVRAKMAPAVPSDWQQEADRQIDFYATELARGNPMSLTEDSEGRERARQYLRQVKGIDRLYANILENADTSVKTTNRLSDLAPGYTQVLKGPNEVRPVFSAGGWAYLEKASKEGGTATLGESCVVGATSGMVASYKQNSQTAREIQHIFLRDYVDNWRKFVEGFSVVKYANAGDAAHKLETLGDRKSPILAVFVMTANATNYPSQVAQANAIQKGIESLKRAANDAKSSTGAAAKGADSLDSPSDISKFFQPVHTVEPPGADTWVGEKAGAYVEALAQLRLSMQGIAQSGKLDPAVHQLAGQNFDKALDVVRGIARGFKPVGVGDLDATVERLLAEPIRLTSPFIIRNMEAAGVGKINGDLKAFCSSQRNTLGKFPFQSASNDDATLTEFDALFNPATGAIWKFQQQSLAEYAVKQNGVWQPKDPSKKPQITSDTLRFLNRCQSIAESFYPAGANQPRLAYTLRARLDPIRQKEFALELEMGGQVTQMTVFQKDFSWPPPAGTESAGTIARLRSPNLVIPVASEGGLWGIFRVFADAEPRDSGVKLVEWKYTRSGRGRKEPLDPPVNVEIVSFPGGKDVFNPKYWEGMHCPVTAVQ